MSLDKEPISDSSNARTDDGNGRRAFLVVIGTLAVAAIIAYLLKSNITSQREIGPIHAVAFCPGDRQVITANQDGTIRLWDAATGQEVRCYRSDQSAAGRAVVSPDGRHILATQNYGQLHGMVMWDLNSGQVVRCFRGHTAPVNAVAFCPDNIHVVSVSSDRTVRIWDTTNGLETKCLQGHEGDVNAVAVTKDGRYVISGAGDYSGGGIT